MWVHEALDFTPWLLAHADTLGDAIDMDLEFDESEHAVGDFSLDLRGRDLRSGALVFVENQLEATDHTHLGQLLTYACGAATGEPVNLVWIAKRFREEHRAAIDWLNTRTDPGTRFFGVELSAVRIDGSRPAPLFRAVATPNDWGKAVRAAASDAVPKGRALLYGAFWEQFLEALREAGLGWSKARKPPRENWSPTAERPRRYGGDGIGRSYRLGCQNGECRVHDRQSSPPLMCGRSSQSPSESGPGHGNAGILDVRIGAPPRGPPGGLATVLRAVTHE